MKTMTDNITGRDGLIIAKALAYAIETIERLPVEWRELSDQEDMVRLLTAMLGAKSAQQARIAARATLTRRGIDVQHGELVVADRPPGTVVEFPDRERSPK